MVMAFHPAYLSCFLKAQHALLEMDGPLPRHWRHYIAIMVRKLHCDIGQLPELLSEDTPKATEMEKMADTAKMISKKCHVNYNNICT